MKIEHRLRAFLQRVIDELKPDLIVPVERKGTAILRALIDSLEDGPLKWRWSDVISSAVLSSVNPAILADRRIVVFDELLRHGRRVTKTVNELLAKNVRRDNIMTAVFAVHEDCTRELNQFAFSHLDDEWYGRYRQEIVEMLQRRGSLLLDTEHVEVLLRIEGSLRDFVDMLSVCGEGVAVFRSGSHRLNITLDHPRIDRQSIRSFLPDGCDLDGVVNKCRIVRTNNPSEFALIPIFFADTPRQASAEWYKSLPSFLQTGERTPKSLFYTVGLLAALQLLGSVVNTLRRFDTGVIVDVPRFNPEPEGAKGGRATAPLNHLLAIYPHINGPDLEAYVSEIMLQARATPRKRSRAKVIDLSDVELDQSVRELGAMVVTKTDQKLVDASESVESYDTRAFGLPNRLLYALAENRLGMSRALTSAAIDRLIDEAYLVTKVENTHGSGASARWGRTFEPDGEIASSRIRRFVATRFRRQLKDV